MRKRKTLTIVTLIIVLFWLVPVHGQKLSMTFLDGLNRPTASSPELSPDSRLAVYTISTLNWEKRSRNTDVYLVSTEGGEARQMTFTPDKSENNPRFSPDGKDILFTSDRDGKNHLYYMRVDGGEAHNATSQHKEGIGDYAVSEDGKWIAYEVTEKKKSQLWIMPADESGKGRKLTNHESSVEDWQWGPLSDKIYFTAPDWAGEIEEKRKEKKFDVVIKDQIGIPNHIWEITVDSGTEHQLTRGADITDGDFTVSKDGSWMGLIRRPHARYPDRKESELFLLNLRTGSIQRLTENKIWESSLRFTPDSKYMYFTKPDGDTYMRNNKIWVKPVEDGEWKKLLPEEDVSAGVSFWAEDNTTFFLTIGEGVQRNIFKSGINESTLERVTEFDGVIGVSYREKNKKVVISYTDPKTPTDYYYADPRDIGNRSRWIRLTDADPDVKKFVLADCETIHWKSKDGTLIEGLLYTPPDLDPDRRYPLIVQIHGGPASASRRSFSASHGRYVHIFAAHDYVVFQPNYRGSSNYGEKFKMEIAGNYFQKGFEDIMTGVDYLIDRGIAHPDSLGHMGWSAGGHWSNWALVQTDRFKAISSGAGGMNWISMYAQTDVQQTREFYFVGMPYDNFEGYWNVSPLKYIKNAKTPTLIHVGKDDPRVPRPQSEELHMALKKLGVPTEFIVYPNMPHGLTEVRYQMVKMASEFYWFEKWIRGREGWFDWQELLDTLEEKESREEEQK